MLIQCKQKQEFNKSFYNKSIGLYNDSILNSNEIMLFNCIDKNILKIKYFEKNNDTTIYKFYLKDAITYETKAFKLNNRTEHIYKYFWNTDDIPDSEIAIYLTKKKEILVIKDISWVITHSFYKDDYEKQLIKLLLKDTSGFFNNPLPPTPPKPKDIE